MTWADDRRADRLAAAEIRILEADAKADRDRKSRTADETARRNRRKDRREKRKKFRDDTRVWLTEHRVRLTIALLAIASAVMAIPAMATFGYHVYGSATGVVLPVLSELGAWAFTFAVHEARAKHKPVWALLAGVWLFAIGGAAMNVAHGIGHGPGDAAVMGFAAIAGIVAHQLAVASPRRSAAERAAARLARLANRRVVRARRAAIGDAVVEVDAAGTVTLVFAAGRYRLAKGPRRRLEAIVEADRHAGDVLAEEIEAFLSEPPKAPPGPADTSIVDAPVLTLDPPADQRESRPTRRTIRAPQQRTFAELQAAFAAALVDPDSPMDPTSAESIRKTLRCAVKTARKLRDEHKNGGGAR
jgi:hypothetical protein